MMKELAVLARPSRTAPFPPFDPTKINVSELPDTMRPKHYSITATNGVGCIEWTTQEAWPKCEDDYRTRIRHIIGGACR